VSATGVAHRHRITIAISASGAPQSHRLARSRSSMRAATYNPRLSVSETAMEAERLNQIAATAASLTQRTAELRRYL
jgi:hypothetical protein